jgi:WD40 repeat protein
MSSGGEGGSKRSHDGEPRPSEKSNGEKKKGRKNGVAAAAASDPSSSAMMAPLNAAPLSVTAEEINYLIYRYLQESGFAHTSFTFAHESLAGKLRPRNSSSIPPGALVLFLQKGLQYIGMEEGLRRQQTVSNSGGGGSAEEDEEKKQPSIHKDDADFTLLCPRALHTLKQKEPPIKLRVPPASAAAVIKAKMEMEEKIARERAAIYGKKRGKKQQVFYEEEVEEEMVDEEQQQMMVQVHKKKGKGKKKAAVMAEEEEDETMNDVVHAATALSPKRRKKKKKAMEVEEEEEGQIDETTELPAKKPSAKKAKSTAAASMMIDVDEVDSAKQKKQEQLQKIRHHEQHHQQQALQLQQQQQQRSNAQLTSQQQQQLAVQRFQEAQRLQQEAANAQQQMFQNNNSDNRGQLQSYTTALDTDAEAAELARQQAQIQAVLAQRQQAVLTGQRAGVNMQQQQPGIQGEDPARAIAAALMASAKSQGAGGVNAVQPNAIPSNSANGKANTNQGLNNNATMAPPPPMQDKRAGNEGQEVRRPAMDAQTLAEIETEDRLKAIHPIEVMELSEHTSEVFMCAWNPRFTNLIATGSGDASARIWAINPPNATGGCQRSILLPHGISSTDKKNKDVTTLEWSPSGELLATGSYDGVARVWSRSGELIETLKGHRGPIFSLKWNKRGNFLLSGSYDKTTIVWDVSGKRGVIKQQFSFHFAPALDVDWKDDLTFASCSTDKTVQICRVGSSTPLKTFSGHADEVNAVKWDPSGTLLASCSDDCTAKVWDVNSTSGLPKWDFKSHQQEIYTVKWSPTGPGSKNPNKPLMLATASFDGSVRLWNVYDGTCARILSRHRESVYSVAFSPTGDYLASGSLAGQLYIWNVRDGQIIKSFKGKGDIFEVAWNIEESRVAACFSSNVVSVIDFQRP